LVFQTKGVGSGFLVQYDNSRKVGVLLTAYHVYEAYKADNLQIVFDYTNDLNVDPVMTHKVETLLESSSDTDLDYALLRISPIVGVEIPSDIEPLEQFMNPAFFEDSFWTLWRKLFVFGHPKDAKVAKRNCFPTGYKATLCRNVSSFVLSDDSINTESPAEYMHKTKEFASNQMAMIMESCCNDKDKDQASCFYDEMKESSRRNYRDSETASKELFSQLQKLLDTRRFLMGNEMTWGVSGSPVVNSLLPGGQIVGMFLCGYPEPYGEQQFRAKDFKATQGVKLCSLPSTMFN
jgi:hypothetical protein